MIYQPVEPPFPPSLLYQLSRKQAEQYFSWFLEQIPVRVNTLEVAVTSTSGYKLWKADLSPGSLNDLAIWFYERVETRPTIKDEQLRDTNDAPQWVRHIELPNWDLTSNTFSLAFDIGIYLGQTLKENGNDVIWRLYIEHKDDVNYHQPVLIGRKNFPMNPIYVVTVYAYGIAEKTKGPERLRQLYDRWANLL